MQIHAEFAAGLAAHSSKIPFDDDRPLSWQQGWSYAAGLASHAAGRPLREACDCAVCTMCTSWRAGWLAGAVEAPSQAH